MLESLFDWIARHPQQAQWLLVGAVVLMALVAFRVVLSLVGRMILVVFCLALSLGGSYLVVRIRQGRLTKHSRVRLRARVVAGSWKGVGRSCRIDVDVEHLVLEKVSWGCGSFEPDRSKLLPAVCRLKMRCGHWVRSIETGRTCRFAEATRHVTLTCENCGSADSVTLDTQRGDLLYSEGGRRLVAKLLF